MTRISGEPSVTNTRFSRASTTIPANGFPAGLSNVATLLPDFGSRMIKRLLRSLGFMMRNPFTGFTWSDTISNFVANGTSTVRTSFPALMSMTG